MINRAIRRAAAKQAQRTDVRSEERQHDPYWDDILRHPHDPPTRLLWTGKRMLPLR